jgi:hypothetical protein
MGEIEKIQEVRDYVLSHIDWECEVKTLFRENNLGCRVAVSTAIDWFFKNEEMGIILEDDCIPDLSFFQFCQELLEKYRDDKRIMSIVAPNIQGSNLMLEHSYCYSRYSLIWGWATWKRAWQYYDSEMSIWPIIRNTNWLLMIGNGNRNFQFYWTSIFDRTYANEIDSWAYRWIFSCWCQNGLSILPANNLVRNIGFGADATHTKKTNKLAILENLQEISIDFPLIHPKHIYQHYDNDQFIDRNWYKINTINRIKVVIKINKIKAIIIEFFQSLYKTKNI